ncbi:hypothetical protein DZF95_00895 [Clavibacter michiganensis]|nr:hypothetical protein DZF95_00895 [Clavibacter michiganensis]
MVLWAASLIVAVTGSSATTWWLLRDPGTAAGVIALGPSKAVLPFESVDGGQVLSGEFYGLTVAKLPKNADVAQLDDDCLSITPVSIYPDAMGVYGCGAGGAPASVPMNVTDDAPDELREEFPVGTTLVFTLDDESVHVRSIGE